MGISQGSTTIPPQTRYDADTQFFRRISIVPLNLISEFKPPLQVTPWEENDFEILIPFVGRCVQKVRNRHTNKVMACKTIIWHRSNIIREWKAISLTDHVNIVQFCGIYTLPEWNGVKILMEFCEGGSLAIIRERISKMGRPIEENVVGWLAEGILQGLAYLDVMKVVRRDLEPSNILLTAAGVVKLCAFGNNLSSSTRGLDRGFYLAPERASSFAAVTTRSEMWSVGISLLELVENRHPIPCRTGMFTLIDRGESPRLSGDWSDLMKDWFGRILTYDAHERPLPQEMLSHSWLVKVMKENVDMALWLRRIWDGRKPWPRTPEVASLRSAFSATDADPLQPRLTTSNDYGYDETHGMRYTTLNARQVVRRFFVGRMSKGGALTKRILRRADVPTDKDRSSDRTT